MIREMVLAAKKVKVQPPVKMGDVLAENFLDTGSDLIASETVDE
jgi:CxxC motif-containing protein